MQQIDFNKIAEENIIFSESSDGDFNILVKDEIGKIDLNMKNLGKFSVYKWQSYFSETTKIYTDSCLPSVEFCILNQSKNGVKMNANQTNIAIKSGMCNMVFNYESGEGYNIFAKNDNTFLSGFFIAKEHFLRLTHRYPEIFEKIMTRYQQEKFFFLSDKNCIPLTLEMNTILQQLEQSHLMGNACERYAEIKILELFILQQQLLKDQSKPKIHCKNQSDIDKIHEVRHLLLSNLHNPLSLSQLSQKVGLNENKLKYGFKEIFGTTVFGYLFDYKMQLAKQLLSETNKPICEIAEACGYDYVSHFSTAFKRKYKVSPAGFRG